MGKTYDFNTAETLNTLLLNCIWLIYRTSRKEVQAQCNKSHKSVCLQIYLCIREVDQDIKAVCAEYL